MRATVMYGAHDVRVDTVPDAKIVEPLIGAACGLAGGLYVSRFVETMLFEVTARGIASLALPLGTLLLAAAVAAAIPAWRAACVDPVIALRNE